MNLSVTQLFRIIIYYPKFWTDAINNIFSNAFTDLDIADKYQFRV